MNVHPPYNIYEKVEACLVEALILRSNLSFWIKKQQGHYDFLQRNAELKNKHAGKRAFIVGNAPSINQQDLSLLKNEITFMVNRAFMQDNYQNIQPTFHVFVDPKLTDGTWPLSYIDEVIEKNPDVHLLLNAEWYDLTMFQPYKTKAKTTWLKTKPVSLLFPQRFNPDLTANASSLYVVEQAITAAIYMGIKEIYIMGVEGNGIAYTIMGQDSHAFGKDPDYDNPQAYDIARSMNFTSRWIRSWYAIAKYCSQNDIKLINCTGKGIMNMMEQTSFNAVLDNNHENKTNAKTKHVT